MLPVYPPEILSSIFFAKKKFFITHKKKTVYPTVFASAPKTSPLACACNKIFASSSEKGQYTDRECISLFKPSLSTLSSLYNTYETVIGDRPSFLLEQFSYTAVAVMIATIFFIITCFRFRHQLLNLICHMRSTHNYHFLSKTYHVFCNLSIRFFDIAL